MASKVVFRQAREETIDTVAAAFNANWKDTNFSVEIIMLTYFKLGLGEL